MATNDYALELKKAREEAEAQRKKERAAKTAMAVRAMNGVIRTQRDDRVRFLEEQKRKQEEVQVVEHLHGFRQKHNCETNEQALLQAIAERDLETAEMLIGLIDKVNYESNFMCPNVMSGRASSVCKVTPLYLALMYLEPVSLLSSGTGKLVDALIAAGANFHFGSNFDYRKGLGSSREDTCPKVVGRAIKYVARCIKLGESPELLNKLNMWMNYLVGIVAHLPETIDEEGFLRNILHEDLPIHNQGYSDDYVDGEYAKQNKESREHVIEPLQRMLKEQHYLGYALNQTNIKEIMGDVFRHIAEYCGHHKIVSRGFNLGQHWRMVGPSTDDVKIQQEFYYDRLYYTALSTHIIPKSMGDICHFIQTRVNFSDTKTNDELMRENTGTSVICSNAATAEAVLYNYRYRCRRTVGNDSYPSYGIDATLVIQVRPSSARHDYGLVTVTCRSADSPIPMPSSKQFLYLSEGTLCIAGKRDTVRDAFKLDENTRFQIK